MSKRRPCDAGESVRGAKRYCLPQAAKLGIIESVSLQNFMCHDNLKFDFEPHINFIIGPNGSGKSAVATGIILALGGRSSVTGRYASIKGFVKEGKKNAVVCVTLKNCGDLSYEPEKYGNKVIVERHFTADNSSTYKIKSETGIVISKSKEDLSDILTHMDIHVDNPTTVLTQDMSRTFLTSKNADEKNLYKLFYEGTGLQKLQENYAKVYQLKEAAELSLEAKKKLLQETEKELKQWEKIMNHAKTCSDLENELLWAIALEIEKKLLDKLQKFEEAQNEIIKIQKEKEIKQTEHFKLSENFKSHVMHRQNLEKEIDSIKSSLKELKSQQQSVTKDIREHVGLLDRYKRENGRLNNDIMQAQNALNEALQKNKDDADAEQRERDKKIQKLEAQLSDIQSELQEKTKIWNIYLDEEKDLEKICTSLIAEKEDALKKKLSIEKELMWLNSSTNKESDYGPEMQNAMTSISCCNEFTKPPKGPIGQYLEVLDQEWSFTVEFCLSEKILRAFICDNFQDEKLLHKILSHHFNQSDMPRVFISEYLPAMYNVESFKAVSPYPTVLDMLKIKDPAVANCLIDTIKIESIILINDFDAAIELMMNAPPKYCHSAYLKNGDQIFPEFYRYYSCPKMLHRGLLSPFCEQDIREKENELQSINKEIGNKAKRIRELTEQRKKSSAERKSLDEASVELEIIVKKLNKEIEANRKIEKPRDISDLKSDLDHLIEEKEKMEDKIKNCEVQRSNQEAVLQIINSKLDGENDLISKKQKENQSLNSKIQECRKKLNCLQTSISHYEKSLKTLEGKAKNHEEALSKAKKAAEVAVTNAEKFSACINTERSSTAIKKVLSETKKVLEQVSNCEMENLKRRYEEKTAKLKHAKSELKHIESYIIKINEMMEKRSKKFENILKNTKLCLSMNFITYLNSNGFAGDLIFDDNQQTLIIEAAPKDTESDKRAQTCRALSGGERSFISICFLLSLWEGIEMPFRILDEYDIFMDSHNRHLSVTHLTKVARQKTDVQFIFLSPLEMPIMKDSAYIRVHKMPAPKRTEANEETMQKC